MLQNESCVMGGREKTSLPIHRLGRLLPLMTLVTATLLWAMTPRVCAQATSPSGDTGACAQGRAALATGDLNEAIALLERSVLLDPDHLGCRLLLARAYASGGRTELAEETLREIVRRQPRHREAALSLAHRYAERREHAAVIEVLHAIRPTTADSELERLRSASLLELGRLEEARRSLERIVASGQAGTTDYRRLGNIHFHGKRYALATEAYTACYQHESDDAELHVRLAVCYHHLGAQLGAVSAQTVEKGQPGSIVDDYYLIAPHADDPRLFDVAPRESAIYHVQRALDSGEDSPDLHLLHGDVWLEAGRWAKALAHYRAIEPRVAPAQRARYLFQHARALWGTEDFEGHLARLQEASRLDRVTYGPRLCEAYTLVARRYNQAGDLTRYIETMRQAVRCTPESAALHYQLGNALWEDGQHDAAVRRWRITLESDPDHADRERMLELIRKMRAQRPG
ncbi:MAG: tetratricopeptide repeat protein [bacterium]|nr:tetratricopeptide repeat protein [bacterium]